VVTGAESKRLAKGSSGRSDTEMSFLSSSAASLFADDCWLDLRP
jgi:hypothetical protein